MRAHRLVGAWRVGACLLGACFVARPAFADPDDEKLRSARELFANAERDEDAGRWAEALEKLQRVSQVRLTAGVRYHLALCEEHLGHLAAALGAYAAAEQQARAESAEDVLRLVGKQLTALDPRVPRLTVRVLPPRPDARVTLDGTAIATEALATPIPVDPGQHHAEATVPNFPPAGADTTLHEGESAVLDLNVAAPSPAPADVAAATATPNAASGAGGMSVDRGDHAVRSANRTGAVVTTAVAVALVGAGVGAFLMAGSQHADGVTACAGDPDPSPDACDSQKNAVRAWDYAAAISWLGAATVGTVAVVLWLKPGRGEAPRGAQLTVGPGMFAVRTSF